MQHIILPIHSCLLVKYALVLCTVMLGRLFTFLIESETSPRTILKRIPNGFISVIKRGCSQCYNLLDLGRCLFPIIVDLDFGKEVTKIFMRKGTIVLLIILQLILHI